VSYDLARRLRLNSDAASRFSGLPPSIPGEPVGMPGTAGPVAFGFSFQARNSTLDLGGTSKG